MQNEECDILYVSGIFDYGESVSGSYILYKILKKLNFTLKVLPMFDGTNHPIDTKDFLPYIHPYTQNALEVLLNTIPNHKILIASGNDFNVELIEYICKKFDSKFVLITGTHWMYGNNSEYPELDGAFYGDVISKRAEIYKSIHSYLIPGSTHSVNVHNQSLLKDIPYELIPFPFDEIEIDDSPKNQQTKKVILWGTTQPNQPRKGKDYFENILEWLYKKVDNPEEILIKTIGPKAELKTKFNVEYLGVIPNRTELSKIYKNVKVFALTTIADAGPMMATECVKNSTPLVSFSTNIAADFVKDGKNGYIVNGTEEYADRLIDILYNDKFHIDLDYVKQFNSEEIVVNKYNNFFKKIINDNIS